MALPRMMLSHQPRAAALLAAVSIASGAAVSLVSSSAMALLITVGVITLPLAAAALAMSPSLAVGALVGTQFLGGYEFGTPIGAITVPIVILAMVLLAYLPRILDALRLPSVRVALIVAALFLGGRIVELAHEQPAVVLRTLAQAASYGAMLAVGVWIGVEGRLRPVAAGAAFALLAMAVLGIGVSLGVVPAPDRLADARTIFGIQSPFQRNYGTNFSFDAASLLVSLCVPYLAASALARPGRQRIASAVVLGLLGLAFLLVFQARSMLVQWLLAILVVTALTRGWTVRVASIGIFVALIVVAAFGALYEADPVSSALRADGLRTGFTILTSSPDWIPFGVGAAGTMDVFLRISDLGRIIPWGPGFQPVHNLYVNTFVETGLVQGLLLVGLSCAVAARLLWSRRVGLELTTLRVAFVLVIFAVMVDPIQAKALGLWMTFGMALGWTALREPELRVAIEPGPAAVPYGYHPVAISASARRVGVRPIVGLDERRAQGRPSSAGGGP